MKKKMMNRFSKTVMVTAVACAWMLPTAVSAAPVQGNWNDIINNFLKNMPKQVQVVGGGACPTFPGNVTFPTYPQQPPVMPTVPTVPTKPVQPSKPTVPTQPTKPTPPTNDNKPTQPNQGDTSFAAQVVNLVNQERAKAGLQPLSTDSRLAAMALDKAKDMYSNNYFDHQSPTYGSPFDMMKQYNIAFGYAGENIAKGQTTPQQVMNDWMNSSGHRANILNANFTHIGVAYYQGEWVQEFISKA
ncbi:CAP domain-containing protein [Paenibacillus terrigena]|uniref:CAP domain-containing protein n=1 Tax=Paenibacillus terrigena TaxID=369333 RepID=UPI00037F90C7|nr:CAP domain-containing protein [Paenibacillus terrigena]